ncbi:hypothetical protein G3R49_12010 [Shewanella sp. WXL01]|uniref:Spondin domain-containing protein n=1 Tax=Shewanella maritima TaxID=2520507 RepID=A0A411PJ38_9GAMM|nr:MULTISPECIES: spondin domain-containing protein [Shewanella]NKF51280.1 hypothetical protein [Shewanella sp. WXL01]QBF83589.1 hypothetical protein EXU30_13460 [Shewanella maritima]
MKFSHESIKPTLALALLSSLLLAGCGHDDDDVVVNNDPEPTPPVMLSYEIAVSNLTANQPLSPVFVATHSADMQLWMAGQASSVALEKLAEGGDTSDLAAISELTSNTTGAGVIMPGMSETLSFSIEQDDVASVSLATMLVNTNDAFAGVNNYDLSQLEVNMPSSMTLRVYDAGTEANSEAKGTLPGPADGGEGYNAARDDVDFIHIHPGVISMYDGLADSVLTPSHRFDNPAIKVTITRTQ